MKILFENKKLEIFCTDIETAKFGLNFSIAKKLVRLTYFLLQENDKKNILNALKNNYVHRLRGAREGQYSVNLKNGEKYRLIFLYLDTNMKIVNTIEEASYIKILEVSKHYE